MVSSYPGQYSSDGYSESGSNFLTNSHHAYNQSGITTEASHHSYPSRATGFTSQPSPADSTPQQQHLQVPQHFSSSSNSFSPPSHHHHNATPPSPTSYNAVQNTATTGYHGNNSGTGGNRHHQQTPPAPAPKHEIFDWMKMSRGPTGQGGRKKQKVKQEMIGQDVVMERVSPVQQDVYAFKPDLAVAPQEVNAGVVHQTTSSHDSSEDGSEDFDGKKLKYLQRNV